MAKKSQVITAKTGLRKIYERFIKIRGNPRDISLGLALGIMIGMSPLVGLQAVSAIFIAALLKWNKISAAIGSLITNPVTTPFIYAFNYYLGSKILGIGNINPALAKKNLTAIVTMVEKAPEILFALVIGGIITGLPLAVVGYYLSYSAVEKYQRDLKEKLARRRELMKERLKKRKSQRTDRKRARKKPGKGTSSS